MSTGCKFDQKVCTFPTEPVSRIVICHATNRFTRLLDKTRQGSKARVPTEFELAELSLRRERKDWSKYTRTCHTWRSHARHFLVRVYFLGSFISSRKERLLEIQKKTALFKDAFIITSSVVSPKSLGVTCRYLYLQGKSPMMSSKSSL